MGDHSEDDHIGDEQRTDRYRKIDLAQLIGERGPSLAVTGNAASRRETASWELVHRGAAD